MVGSNPTLAPKPCKVQGIITIFEGSMKVQININGSVVAHIELCDKQDGNTEITIISADPMDYFEMPDTVPDDEVLWFMQRAMAQISNRLMVEHLPCKYAGIASGSPINN